MCVCVCVCVDGVGGTPGVEPGNETAMVQVILWQVYVCVYVGRGTEGGVGNTATCTLFNLLWINVMTAWASLIKKCKKCRLLLDRVHEITNVSLEITNVALTNRHYLTQWSLVISAESP